MKKKSKIIGLILLIVLTVYALQVYAQGTQRNNNLAGSPPQGGPQGGSQGGPQGGSQGGPQGGIGGGPQGGSQGGPQGGIGGGPQGGPQGNLSNSEPQLFYISIDTIPSDVKISLSRAVEIAKDRANATITFAQLSLVDQALAYAISGINESTKQPVSLLIDPETGDLLSLAEMRNIDSPQINLVKAVSIAEKTADASALSANLSYRADPDGSERLVYSIVLQKDNPASIINTEIDAETGKVFPANSEKTLSKVKVSTVEAIKLASDIYKKRMVSISLTEQKGKALYEINFETDSADKSRTSTVAIDAKTGKVIKRYRVSR